MSSTGLWAGAFWLAIAAIGYTYAVYPGLIYLLCRLKRTRPPGAVASGTEFRPPVAVLVAAHNEEKHIGPRLENLLEQDYPAKELRIYIGSDGSEDRTNAIVADYQNRYPERIRLLDFRQRRGKTSVLNDAMAAIDEAIVVLSDANTQFEPDTVSRLVRHFADPSVGAVCGELHLVDGESRDNHDGLYWRYERFLKLCESRVGGLLGANGGNYAIRRSLYQPLRSDTIVDDFTIAMSIADAGYQLVYDTDADAYEEIAPSLDDEFRRRIRIGAGNYQALFRFPGFLDPRRGIRFFTYVSHKVLRWVVPHCLLIALLASAVLAQQPLYRTLLLIQLAGYAATAGLYLANRTGSLPRVLLFPVFLFSMNLGLGLGFLRYLRGRSTAVWHRTVR